MGEQIELLEHHADAFAHLDKVALAPTDELAVERHLAGAWQLHEIETAQQRALAGTGRAQDGNPLALLDIEIDAFQHLEGAEALGERADVQDRHSLLFSRRSRT